METSKLAQSNRWLLAVRLGVAMALGTLLLAACIWGLREAASVHAGPATLYVDWATGSDTTDCTNYASPCATIGYARNVIICGEQERRISVLMNTPLPPQRIPNAPIVGEKAGFTRTLLKPMLPFSSA